MVEPDGYITVDCNDIAHVFEGGMPVRLEQGGLFLCQGGEGDIVINMKQYKIRKGDMVVAFPFSIIQVITHTGDFCGNMVRADVDFFGMLQIRDKAYHYLYIKENPCISLMEDEWAKILSLYDNILRESADNLHPMRAEIDECLLRIIAYEIVAIYLKRKPIVEQQRSRRQIIFQQFVFSLFSNYQSRRQLEYYSAEQSITPRHLSLVVKEVSGLTAGEWIVGCVVMNIKSRLQDDRLTILQISGEFNFPNASFFSQYFKKYTGLTPREYRVAVNNR